MATGVDLRRWYMPHDKVKAVPYRFAGLGASEAQPF